MANMIVENEKENAKKDSGAPIKARKRKGVDKWKTKKWFQVLAPAVFNNSPVAQTPGEDAEGIMGRRILVSARELTGNIKKSQLMLKFKINNVQGLNAYTSFDGIEAQPGSVRRLVRRRNSKIEAVNDVTCKDGVRARIKSVALCTYKVSGPRRALIREMITSEVVAMAQQNDYETLLTNIVTGDPGAGIVAKAKKISPMKRVDVLKVGRLAAA